MTLTGTVRLRPDEALRIDEPVDIATEALLGRAAALDLRLGDVVVTTVPGGEDDLDRVRAALTGDDVVVERDDTISDVYSSRCGDRLLASARGGSCHHVQFRRYRLHGAPIFQLACYPAPPSARGLLLWCHPAIVWIFVGSTEHGPVDDLLRALQPHWERLLAHHGVPLDAPVPPDLGRRYPVANHLPPLDPAAVDDLRGAVDMLMTQDPVRRLVDQTTSPRAAVDATLDARRVLLRHQDRLDILLEHSHGRARAKYEDMARVCRELTDDDEPGREHLLAPHRHLIDGLENTRLHLERAVSAGTETTSLITSAAVGRLLDRSDANRRTTTAIATVAFLAALVAGFSALAAIPRDDRLLRSFVQLGAWLSFGALVLLAGAYGLARLSAMPSRRVPRRLAAALRLLWPVAGLGALVLMAVAGVTASVPVLATGAGLSVLVAIMRGAVDDY